jgi:hypothetical protein
MEIGWSDLHSGPIIIDELTERVKITEKAHYYVRTEDDGFIILSRDPIKIIHTNLAEVDIYPIISVHELTDDPPDEIFDRLETLAEDCLALENDPVIAKALGFEYVKYKPRTRPEW